MRYKKQIIAFLVSLAAILVVSASQADQDLISVFPLEHYDQTISTWIKPTDANFDKPLLSEADQQKRLAIFKDHYFGSVSPWNPSYINAIFQLPSSSNIQSIEQTILAEFSNEGKPADQLNYAENFRLQPDSWIAGITDNLNVAQFDHLVYQAGNRGIVVDNAQARRLPADEASFYYYQLPGQGYPFDNLQVSALWAGTPVYIIAKTRDRAWVLVLTPDYIGWVKSRSIAEVDDAFINTWSAAAKNKLIAITHTKTGLVDDGGHFLLSAYVGSVFPGEVGMQIMVPAADADGRAVIKHVMVSPDDAAIMPIAATPRHFANLMSTLIGRPYGWGNLYFFNDCSSELKNLFTPFGIWLPRHSADQVTVGKMVDMTSAAPEKRLAYLMENGKPFLTLVYLGAHVVMYIGNVSNPNDHSTMAMTYQNLWGLAPNPATRRSVVGQAVLLPLLLQYPEDTSLVSLANKKYFQVGYLDQLPENNLLMNGQGVDVKSLMSAEKL